jgi:tetratricopeptide (TPR) repeat protein
MFLRFGRLFSGSIVALAGLTSPACAQQETTDGADALRRGDYQTAIDALARAASQPQAAASDYRLLARALSKVGRYDEAEEAVRGGMERVTDPEELHNTLGELLDLRGRVDESGSAFREAMASAASDRNVAALNLAVLQYRQGEVDAAMAAFNGFIDLYNETPDLPPHDLVAVGTALRYLGQRDYRLVHDARRALDEAIAADPSALDARIRLGELFLEKYNGPEARRLFKEVLEVNPNHPAALLGMAKVLDFESQPGAVTSARKSLEVNPSFVPSRVFMARMSLNVEDYAQAIEEAEGALEVNPRSLEALSVLAAARYLKGDEEGFAKTRDRALEINPRYAELFNIAAELLVQSRRYHEGVDLARQAVHVDEDSWRAYAILGTNQLRIGEIQEGRLSLETSFSGDPFNLWTKNTLDLLDTFEHYEIIRTPHFEIMLRADEVELLAPYFSAVSEEAYQRMTERYGYEPTVPIRVEVFPNHSDFSVRTLGLPGLGALGVAFGPVIAMDSPSARGVGEFNWGSTLWHEIAHVVHLGMTDHRMPRWLGEGLAVFEERKAREGWGSDVGLPFLMAYESGRLLPFSQLNNGFVRPSYPQQVAFSYLQASLVLELIEERNGFPAILDMLAGYRQGRSTDEIVRAVLGTDVEEVDELFDDYLRKRFAGPLAAIYGFPEAPAGRGANQLSRAVDKDDFLANLAAGKQLTDEGRAEEAIPFLERAKELFPEYAAPDSPYWYLATIYTEKGDEERAAAELEALTSLNETHYAANLRLASLRQATGNVAGAAAALERALYIHPYEIPVHERLADLYAQMADWVSAVQERRSALALEPVDRAGALYRLARAHFEAGDRAAARRAVLQTLEIAPNFQEAQELLLQLRQAGGK